MSSALTSKHDTGRITISPLRVKQVSRFPAGIKRKHVGVGVRNVRQKATE